MGEIQIPVRRRHPWSSMAAESDTRLPNLLCFYIKSKQLNIIPYLQFLHSHLYRQIAQMAALKSLVSVALLALLLFSESLTASAVDRSGDSNSLTGMLRRNVLQTAAHQIADNSVESSPERKMNVHIKRRMRPVATGTRSSAANRSRIASIGVGSVLVVLGLFL